MITLLLLVSMMQSEGDPLTSPGAPTISSIKGADLGLLQEVRVIASTVTKLREQEFDRPSVAVRVQAPMREVADEIRAFNVLPSARLESRGRAWEDVGLGTRETPMRLLRILARDLDGIGFDPGANRLLFSPDLLSPSDFEPQEQEGDPATMLLMTGVRPDEPMVAHILMHIRQRERSGHDFLAATTDEMLAAAAWAEGEANLVALRYLFRGLGMEDDILHLSIEPGSVLDGRLLPSGGETLSATEAALVEFVYLDGFDQAARHFRSGGWPALDRAMVERRTTLDLTDPERPPSASPSPRLPRPPLEGLTLADEDSLGERGTAILIAQATGKDNLGLMAGQGWRADRLVRWEGEGARGVTDWVSVWSSESSARVFEQAYLRALSSRFPAAVIEDEQAGAKRLVAGNSVFAVLKTGPQVHVRVYPTDWIDRLSAPDSAPVSPPD